jgi:SpoIID/LytB domain protein
MRVFFLLGAAVLALTGATVASAAPIKPKGKRAPTFVIRGRGWGHGIGLAQYGALGYARHGFSYRKILKHYYRGTRLKQTKVKQVRVLLADWTSRIEIFSRKTFRVRDADGVSYRLAPGHYRIGPRLKVKVDPDQAPRPLPGPILFTPGQVPLVLDRPYRGSMLVSSSGSAVRAVNLVGLEDYVRGVVPDEVPEEWPAGALKAQAVASRTYVVATRKRGGPFDVYPDTRSQVYGGVDAEEFSTNAAVEATAGQIVAYHQKPALTYFFASSGGRTAAIQDAWPGSTPVPYLVSVPDPYDTASPYHRWGPYQFSAKALAARLRLPGKPLDAKTRRNPSRRVTKVVFTTASGQTTKLGTDIRVALGLRSTWFSLGVLALDRPSKPLTYGVQSTLSGIARGVGHLRLEQRVSGVWERAGKVRRRRGGKFAAAVKPVLTRKYRVSNGRISSAPVRVEVAPFVRLDPPAEASSLTGHVRPALKGKIVSVQRKTDSGWPRVAKATVDGNGRFRAELSLRPGTYRARLAPGGGLVPGTSRIVRVVETRVASAARSLRHLAFSPNDPLATRQWYLSQTRAFDFWPDLPELPGVRVAVVDSGIDGGHPELKQRIAAARTFVGGSALRDKVGHGTFVAGEIAATTNNAIGIAGIGLPAELLIAKVVRSDRTIPIEAEARAIRWAVRRGAKVINLSLSGLRDPLNPHRDTYSRREAAAIRYAYRKGAVIVAAVGNSDQAPRSPWNFAGYPAALPHVIGVSAVNRSGAVPGFSNRDVVYNDLSAPGSDIFSTLPRALSSGGDCDEGYSGCGPAEFRHAAGTSFSAPMISAAAALVRALRPSLSPDQVSFVLERAARDMNGANGCRPCPRGRDRLTGWGRLDVTAALERATSGTVVRKDVRETNDEAGGQASTLRGRKGKIKATLDYWDDQIDVYRLRLRRGRHLSVSLHGPARGDSNLLLWKPGTRKVDDLSPQGQSRRVAQSLRAGPVQNIRRYRAKVSGWYFIEAKLASKSAGPYSLRFTKSR